MFTSGTATPYAELHCRSVFSLLDGASHASELIARALELGLPSLAITDVNGLYGIVEAREALIDRFELRRIEEPRAPLRLRYGSELTFEGDLAVALVADLSGYRNLCQTLAVGRLAAPKGEFLLTRGQLCERPGGLYLLAGGPRSEAMRKLCDDDVKGAERNLSVLREAFGDRLLVELVRHLAPGDRERSLAMAALAKRLGIGVVATNDVCFHEPKRKPIHDVLRCIREGVTLAQAGRRLLPNAEAHLKSAAQMAALFSDLPHAVERAAELARSIDFSLCEVTYSYPSPELPAGIDADPYLAQLARRGLIDRLEGKATQYVEQLERELRLIAEMQYAGYFLTMWDIIGECGRRGILCQGRGSAANSLVCFALGITSVRPDVIHMLFERFLSKERNEPPDIDLDIEHQRREEILQYVYEKYGRERAGMVAEVIRYRRRSALRDVGRVLGFPEAKLARMSKFLSHYWEELDVRAIRAAGLEPGSPTLALLLKLAQDLEHIPRHLSIHVGGFVLSREPLAQTVPIENGRMAKRTVIQWSKDDVDAMGMFKLDLLGLGMLTVLSQTFEWVRKQRGISLTLQTVPPDDPATYQMLQKADSIGVFQVESRAQMNMLPRLQPREFYDLVIEVAIVRPGPIQGKMVHPYLRRRQGKEIVEYPHKSLEPILHRTLGVPLFQEQVMRLAEAVGGYTAGQADQLRRDMASWRSSGKMDRHKEKLLEGMLKNGLTPQFAERVFQQIQGFGSYGFPESHAAAFAHLAYVSAYLKCHYPVELACALLNSQPMGFYSPSVIVSDLKRHGGAILPTDVQHSDWDCSLEGGALRLGLRLVSGLGETAGRSIVLVRRERPFSSEADLAHRARLPAKALIPLAASGALKSLSSRREAIWKVSALSQSAGPLLDGIPPNETVPDLAPMPLSQELALDARYASTFPGKHPMELLRAELSKQGVLTAQQLERAEPDRTVQVAGLVITRQRPGSGNMIYITLEDETGHVDLSVTAGAFIHFQEVIRSSGALIARGRLVSDGNARNVSVAQLTRLQIRSGVPSHDFH